MEVTQLPAAPLAEVLHYLGWHGQPVEESLLEDIRRGQEMLEISGPARVIFRKWPAEQLSFVLEGQEMAHHLQDCREVICLAATLGARVEQCLRRESRDPAFALILDACASAAVEALCDAQEARLRAQLLQEGRFLTDRFSPGYGDFPMERSKDLVDLLDASRRIGLTVSRSGILIPRKSVTAVLGICDRPVPRRPSRCALCAKSDCPFREERDSYEERKE